ncbi:unnamed protein product [Alopecurus aequalis]
MWALLLDHDPGNSAVASDLAVDVVEQKLKKAAAVTKPAKHGENARIDKKTAVSGSLVVEVVKRTNNMVKKEKKGDAGDDMQAANVHVDRAVQVNGVGDNKQTSSAGDELTNGREEMKEMLDALRRIEEAQEEKAFIDVVAKGGGRRRTVAGQTRKAAPVVEGGITGANMWALLSDDEPSSASVADIAEEEEAAPADNVRAGPGDAKLKKRGKKTKTKQKKRDAGNSKQAEPISHQKKETPASELEEEMSEEEEEMTDEASTAGSRWRMVAWRVCRAAVAVAMLATYFQLASTPSVA